MMINARRNGRDRILAAIDVGTNAVRLEIARPLPDGAIETLHQERDPVRPGEGVFRTGSMPPEVAERLLSTLRRYAALCRRYRARVRAVATSAIREARNGQEIVERVRAEAGLDLQVVSGQEEARLICLGVLHGKPPGTRSLVIDIGGGSTEVAVAVGERPTELASVPLGAVRLTEIFSSSGRVPPQRLALMRKYAAEGFREAIPRPLAGPRRAIGSSGTINAIVSFVADHGVRRVSLRELEGAVEELADMGIGERRRRFDARRAEIIVAGAVILEAAMQQLRLSSVAAVDTGLRNGVLVDLMRRFNASPPDHSAAEAALALGRRFHFDEAHARQVARIALALFDGLAALHRLPAGARDLLEAASVLHDIGHTVSPQRHHKHTFYLVANSDIPGFANRERELVALVARYHRRSPPERRRADLQTLSTSDFRMVRKLATLLRVADSLDRSHRQPVAALEVAVESAAVRLRLRARAPLDLESWDVQHETSLFRRVFGRRLELSISSR